MKRRCRLLLILVCLMLTACGTGSPAAVPDAPAGVRDITGEELDLTGDFLYARYNEVYARTTTGFYTDNRSAPDQFDSEGTYTGGWQLPDEVVWRLLTREAPPEGYSLSSGYSQQQVNAAAGTAVPVEQRVELTDVTLTGVLRLVETGRDTGSIYGMNEAPGDLFFYPYPESMGDFPFIDYGSSVTYPLTVAGERTDFSFAADTPRIWLGNLDEDTLRYPSAAAGEVRALFAGSDLIEATVAFRQLSISYTRDAPPSYTSVIDSLEKTAGL